MSDKTHISVVVCTYNRAPLLREAILSLARLECDGRFSYDIVVIDNASTDDTPSVVHELSHLTDVQVTGVREDRPGISYARNRGVEEATGDWIAFFDDDGIADPKWLDASQMIAKELKGPGGLTCPTDVVESSLRISIGADTSEVEIIVGIIATSAKKPAPT